ncbi:iron(III) ABC transporter [Pseudomonas daroniae]|uniref:Iron(III) ABC transporter n=1 Tax=Phytopseudomonas daroniae TaxID=2487519 RepID=A0A4Q9QR77_9GAMM|nr:MULTISPECIES: ChaN family lipoprotein [Pseudomonas]TBU78612.1 iron(III) ABC transporter [Pseudomonas daroniae]TBU82722.1 iron(III) ABC transporter [Pseudomonas daroniae]TBU86077.1 iron(III) ABC transporter [Pseudomonas sp. FRB 228]TBU95240.1 iron(III) ABC transporter [Pseudomonas daroniae]
MRTLLLFAVLVLSACQGQPVLAPLPEWQSPQGREHAELGQIRDLHSGERLTPEQLVARLAVMPHVLVGEQHDNPDHHALQLWLLRALEQRRKQGGLLLEMLASGQQPLADNVAQQMREGRQIDDLPKALEWSNGWPWTLYGPIVRHGLAQDHGLRAANLDRAEIMAIYREQPVLQGRASTAATVREPLLAQIRESHCDKLPVSQLPAMLAVQQQRDRRMAERLLAAPQPAMLFAGAFHVRRDLGVPLHLSDLGASATAQVLILAEVGKPVTAEQADYVWYTAALPAEDHCARFQ